MFSVLHIYIYMVFGDKGKYIIYLSRTSINLKCFWLQSKNYVTWNDMRNFIKENQSTDFGNFTNTVHNLIFFGG